MTEVLHVQLREKTGSADSRRLRRAGQTPAILYGHGEENVSLTVPTAEIAAMLRHHDKTVKLTGGVDSDALVKDIHFDPLGIEVLHLDFFRVSLDETVTVTVPVKAHGEVTEGMLHEVVHEVEIACPAGRIPNELEYGVNDWKIGDSLIASQLELPSGASLEIDGDTVIAQVEEIRVEEPVEDEEAETEPEVIGAKEETEESTE